MLTNKINENIKNRSKKWLQKVAVIW